MVQKRLVHFSANPYFIIGLKIKVSWWKVRGRGANKELVQRLLKQVHLPGQFTLFVQEKSLKALGVKVFQTPGAFLYRRGEEV